MADRVRISPEFKTLSEAAAFAEQMEALLPDNVEVYNIGKKRGFAYDSPDTWQATIYISETEDDEW